MPWKTGWHAYALDCPGAPQQRRDSGEGRHIKRKENIVKGRSTYQEEGRYVKRKEDILRGRRTSGFGR